VPVWKPRNARQRHAASKRSVIHQQRRHSNLQRPRPRIAPPLLRRLQRLTSSVSWCQTGRRCLCPPTNRLSIRLRSSSYTCAGCTASRLPTRSTAQFGDRLCQHSCQTCQRCPAYISACAACSYARELHGLTDVLLSADYLRTWHVTQRHKPISSRLWRCGTRH
jgi:hypothetical protein